MKITTLTDKLVMRPVEEKQKGTVNSTDSVREIKRQDKIELSESSKEVLNYVEMTKQLGESKSDRIEQIKLQMKQGTYQVSSQEIAKAMLNNIKQQ